MKAYIPIWKYKGLMMEVMVLKNQVFQSNMAQSS